jgi:hypothetical protein
MAPRQGVAVRAGDQPRATTGSMDTATEPARLQYRVENIRATDNRNVSRDMSRRPTRS